MTVEPPDRTEATGLPKRVLIGDDQFSVAALSGDPTLLFLHGLAGHSGEWDRVIARLAANVGFINPDLRAHGRTWEFGTRNVSKAEFVNDAVTLAEHLADGPVIVVGQSMGGTVATLMAHARPDLVSHLVLIEAGMGSMTEPDLDGLKQWFDSWPEVFADEAEATEFFGATERSTPAWVQGLARTRRGLEARFDPDSMIATMRTLATDDRWSAWSELGVRVTLIRAANSMLDDAEIDRMIELRPSAQLVVFEDCGHDVHLDQPAMVAELLGNLV